MTPQTLNARGNSEKQSTKYGLELDNQKRGPETTTMVIDRMAEGLSGPPKFSSFVLVFANMIPVLGVILWDWKVFDIVSLYWAENIVIGLLNIPRILMARGGAASHLAMRSFTALFFTLHFGVFCSVHGFFVFSLLGNQGSPLSSFPQMLGLATALTAMVISHLFSFFWNYIGQREYREKDPSLQMFAPYGRVVILHIAILFGAFAVDMLGSPLLLLLVLIVGKTALDLGFHLFSHQVKPR